MTWLEVVVVAIVPFVVARVGFVMVVLRDKNDGRSNR